MDDTAGAQRFSLKGPGVVSRIARIPAALHRPIVLVLGMHRSGTSLCSNILSMLGIDMADTIAGPRLASPGPDNPHGHWERWEIAEFHDRILALFDREYLGPFHDFPLPVAWWADPRVAQIRREMIAFLQRRMGDTIFGFKDPRTIRLLPVWHQIIAELQLAPKIVLCLRNPAQVARSLHARDGLDPEIGEYRWLVHMIDFFRYLNAYDFSLVEYEAWFDRPDKNVERLRDFLGVEWQQSASELNLALSGIIDPGLRHDEGWRRERATRWCALSTGLPRALRRSAQPASRSAMSLPSSSPTNNCKRHFTDHFRPLPVTLRNFP